VVLLTSDPKGVMAKLIRQNTTTESKKA
jgi:hypothetical protein